MFVCFWCSGGGLGNICEGCLGSCWVCLGGCSGGIGMIHRRRCRGRSSRTNTRRNNRQSKSLHCHRTGTIQRIEMTLQNLILSLQLLNHDLHLLHKYPLTIPRPLRMHPIPLPTNLIQFRRSALRSILPQQLIINPIVWIACHGKSQDSLMLRHGHFFSSTGRSTHFLFSAMLARKNKSRQLRNFRRVGNIFCTPLQQILHSRIHISALSLFLTKHAQ
mmetsp:Transcript_2413/g.3795  ORF Transcript_2413/g.3795 Transcript_2413/m.3795 type:complete len:218 (-) Transcript_2413:799-1452(-)